MDNFLLISTAWSALKRHSLLAAAAFISASLGSVIYLILTPPLYTSSARIMLDEGETTVSDLGRSLTELDSPGAGSDPLATQSELITSEAVYAKALEILEVNDVPVSLTTGELDANLKVRIIPATNILELDYLYTDPEIAADILNAVVQSTAEVNGENIRRNASQIRVFLEEQIPKQEARLAEAEDAEREFRQESGIVSLDRQVVALVDGLSDLEREERQITAQLQALEEKAGLLQNITGAEAIQDAYRSVQLGQDETLTGLRNRIVGLEAQIVESGSRLGPQHPDYLALLEQRENLQLLYQRQLEQRHDGVQSTSEYLAIGSSSQELMNQLINDSVEYEALSERLAVVQLDIEDIRSRLIDVPALSQPLSVLTRQRQTAEETLRNLKLNLEEAEIAEAQLVSNITILGEASVPNEPSEPSKPAVLFLGIVSGLVLASILLILLEAIDNTLHNAEEAKAWLGYPVLGELPAYDSKKLSSQGFDDYLSDPKFVAPYHSLINTIRYSLALEVANDAAEFEVNNVPKGFFEIASSETRSKTILLSSAFWGEGKSLVSRNLAAVSAILGQRTLLIDADLLSCYQTSYFNLHGTYGLSDVVESREGFLDACKTSHIENLSVLPVGRLTNQPAAIISSPTLKEIMELAAGHYDCVVLDIPPITESPACIALSQYAGGLFLIMRPDFKSKHDLRRATSDFIQSGGKLFGQVINRQGDPESEMETVHLPMLEKLPSAVLSNHY